jgi:hypothetical protein
MPSLSNGFWEARVKNLVQCLFQSGILLGCWRVYQEYGGWGRGDAAITQSLDPGKPQVSTACDSTMGLSHGDFGVR